MTTEKDDSAFPVFDSQGLVLRNEYCNWEGLTKREYFAAIALQGLLAGGKYPLNTTPYHAVQLANLLIKRLNMNEKPNSEEQPQEEEGTEA